MGLIDEAIEIGARKQGPRCKVSMFLDTLKPKERAEWEELMAAPRTISHAQIRAVFVNHGHPEITLDMVTRHRNNGCATCR